MKVKGALTELAKQLSKLRGAPSLLFITTQPPDAFLKRQAGKQNPKSKQGKKTLKQTKLIFPAKADSFSHPRARQTASPLTAQRARQFFRVPHLLSYSVGLIREMPVSILQASIKLLNAPFHLVFLLLTVTFRAPHGSLLSHFYLPTPFPFQADQPHTPSLAARTPPLPEHL